MKTLQEAAQQALEAIEKELDPSWECNSYYPALTSAADALRQALEVKDAEWPKLDKPARIGGGSFGVSVSARHVVEAAQRAFEEHIRIASLTDGQRAEEERNRRKLFDLLHGPIEDEQEPYIWYDIDTGATFTREDLDDGTAPASGLIPLYTQPQHEREPLTDEQEAFGEWWDMHPSLTKLQASLLWREQRAHSIGQAGGEV